MQATMHDDHMNPQTTNQGNGGNSPGVKTHLKNKGIWQRGLYMLFYSLAYAIAEALLVIVALFQFFAALFTGTINASLHKFGHNLSRYILQITQYLTFNSEVTPYPFAEWPGVDAEASPWSTTHSTTEAANTETAASTNDVAETEVSTDTPEDVADNTPPEAKS